jgi:hypothetical protein
VPDYPEAALDAAIEALKQRSAQEPGSPGESAARWHAVVALDAAAPLLADACATAILAHMNAYGPHEGPLLSGWRRHFGIAARVAARAFTTRDEELRTAAEAVKRGDYAVCDIPDVPDEEEQ